MLCLSLEIILLELLCLAASPSFLLFNSMSFLTLFDPVEMVSPELVLNGKFLALPLYSKEVLNVDRTPE